MKPRLNERLKRMLAQINPAAYAAIYRDTTTNHDTSRRVTTQRNTTSELTHKLGQLVVKPKSRPIPGQKQV